MEYQVVPMSYQQTQPQMPMMNMNTLPQQPMMNINMMIPKQLNTEDEMAKNSITIQKKSKCCPCYPEYRIHDTAGDRDIGKKKFDVKPTTNFFCCQYQIDINNLDNNDFLKTKRTGCWWCPDYDSYSQDGNFLGKNQFKCCSCIPGSYVYVRENKKYWIGQDCKDFLCAGDSITIKDIWNQSRTLRVGSILNIRRIAFCYFLLQWLGFCDCCFCCCVTHWNKINFPQDATSEEKTMIMASASNQLGENICCFLPYDSPNYHHL